MNKPPVLLADEPTGNLDSELSREILELFRQFNQVGVCVPIATHDLNLVRQEGYRAASLNQGKLIGNGIVRTSGATNSVSGLSDRLRSWIAHHRLGCLSTISDLLKIDVSLLTWLVIGIALACSITFYYLKQCCPNRCWMGRESSVQCLSSG